MKLSQNLNWLSGSRSLNANVPSIAAVAELELQNFKLRTNE